MFKLTGRLVSAFLRDEQGATAIEYAMIASLLSIAIMTAVLGVSNGTGSLFDSVYTKVVSAIQGS
ncbi:hypothetical protein WH87_11415 [Devosia epidermidihirudinis]|uniref:Pilus assembly protein n=1 Tax=Devosia epidermidihirudinis TaxID=1293439 RepID=A0A0F5QBX0_9HYPH|nr:Flp family type IVb pilin [Devosia epidermidihirudinis]KKC38196.1 hypothetical protein WH87_11415 [Devosia epidermidihirudinis]